MTTTRKHADPTREDRTKALFDQLAERATAFAEGETFQSFLRASAKFHRYSANNQYLIWTQCPDAVAVNSYKRWADLGRQVRKGETGIRILAPRPVRFTREESVNGQTVEKEHAYTKFVSVAVFDYAQTDPIEDFPGTVWEPLEFPRPTEAIGTEQYRRLIDWLNGEGVPVTEDDSITDVCGYYDPNVHAITMGEQVSSLDALHTLIHEAAHALHYATDAEDVKQGSAYREIVAEASAYIVCEAMGYDAADVAGQYVGAYGFRDPAQVPTALPMIQQISHRMIEALTAAPAEIAVAA